MSTVRVLKTIDPPKSFVAAKVSAMFDLSLTEKLTLDYTVDVPSLDEEWSVGLIVGPSGSGKTSLIRQAFGDQTEFDWGQNSIVERLGSDVEKTIELFTSVGLSSPPAWLKPYSVLSNGEKFRADLAASIATSEQLVVIDEFTSLLDRVVARTACIAVSKAIKRQGRRLIAVGCHYDVAEFIEPDWVIDLATYKTTRRRLRRNPIEVSVARSSCDAWPLFAKHHYLDKNLNRSAACYGAFVEDRIVAFCAVLPVFGYAGRSRISRIVTLPDWQGVGIGGFLLDSVAQMYVDEGRKMSIVCSHPSLIKRLRKSEAWIMTAAMATGRSYSWKSKNVKTSHGRSVCSFEFQGVSNA